MAKEAEKPRRQALLALGVETQGVVRIALGRKGFAEAGLMAAWAEIVGRDIAGLALPVKLRIPPARKHRVGGILTLRATGAAAIEVQHLQPLILARVNLYFGYPAIVAIRIVQGHAALPRPPRAPASAVAAIRSALSLEKQLAAIVDPSLKESLAKLGALILQEGIKPAKKRP